MGYLEKKISIADTEERGNLDAQIVPKEQDGDGDSASAYDIPSSLHSHRLMDVKVKQSRQKVVEFLVPNFQLP